MKCKSKTWLSWAICGAAVLSAGMLSGCQVSVGGQTLPSSYYLRDDIQYFPRGPEFKLSREAAAMQAARADDMVGQ